MSAQPSERFMQNIKRLKSEFDTDIVTQKRKNATASDNKTDPNKETHDPERD